MISSRRLFFKHLAKIFDLTAVVAFFIAVTAIMYSSPKDMTLGQFMAIRIKLGNCLLFALLLITWHEVFVLCGLYLSKRLTRRRVEITEVCKATSLASAFLFFAGLIFHIRIVTLEFVLWFWASCTFTMASARLIGRLLLSSIRRRGRNTRFLLVVGTNDRAIEFADNLLKRPELGYRVVGFVDDEWSGLREFEKTGFTRCCGVFEMAEFLRHQVVDEVAIYLPLRSYYEHAAKLIGLCDQHGIAVRVDPQVFKTKNLGSSAISDDDLRPSRPKMGAFAAKRAIDAIFSILALIVLSPVLLIAAFLVKISSPGPILFRQTRVGLNKRQFTILKFRTMITRAEEMQDMLLSQNEMSGPVFKMKNDPRVTAIGRFLRKTSIDELPQLFNVLTGDMSLVGPRAMSLRDYRLFEQGRHSRRFSVKPGITCLWQVNGRSEICFEHWMELDIQYIDKWSLWLDFKILVQTVPAVLRGTGAA